MASCLPEKEVGPDPVASASKMTSFPESSWTGLEPGPGGFGDRHATVWLGPAPEVSSSEHFTEHHPAPMTSSERH
jgi:hypothetical protein